MKVSKKIL